MILFFNAFLVSFIGCRDPGVVGCLLFNILIFYCYCFNPLAVYCSVAYGICYRS